MHALEQSHIKHENGVKWWLLVNELGGLSHADGQLLSQKIIGTYSQACFSILY